MRYHDPKLPQFTVDEPKWAKELKEAIYRAERARPKIPTFMASDGTTDYGVFDYLRFTGAKLSTIGSDGLEVDFNPDYAVCRLSSNLTGVTAETKVTPLATSLSGFTVSSDVLTCTNGGIFRLTLSVIHRANTGAGISSIGYRINGGTTVFPIQHYEATLNAPLNMFAEVLVSLAASDTVEFRFASTATSGQLYADSGFNLVQIST